MSNLQKFLGALVEHAPINLSTAEMQYWIENSSELEGVLAKALIRNSRVAAAVTSALLTHIGTVSLPATSESFEAAKKFVVDTSASAEVKIAYISESFTSWFLAEGGKIEPAQTECELRYAKLKKASHDEPAVLDHGDEAKAETTLTDLWGLLKKQAPGEKGALLTNGNANIFYIRDHQGVLRTVYARCNDRSWVVRAYPVEAPVVRSSALKVFSRNLP